MAARSLEKKAAPWALPTLVFFAVLAAFAPGLDNGFVWDDEYYLLSNHLYRGLGWTQLKWMMTNRTFGLYHPLTWLSYGLDYKLWGMEPWGYHLTNILLHAAAAVLFYFVCRRLIEKAAPRADADAVSLGAAVAALSFAVHPLRVESVAWVSERKDVLSGMLLMASLWAYIEEQVATSLCLYVLSLGAKASGVFLPAGLLVLDAYPLRRGPRWREKVPFLAAAAAATAATMAARAEYIGGHGPAPVNAAWRVGQVFYSLFAYLGKTLWPSHLSAYYPPRPWFGSWLPFALPLAALGAAAAVALWSRRRRYPALAAAAAWYVLALAPVSGIVQQDVLYSLADRFCYLPNLGWAALLGGVIALAAARARGTLLLISAIVISAWGILSWRQSEIWEGPLSLWSHASHVEPSAMAYDNLAVAQGAAARADAAILSDRRALQLDPTYFRAYANLGSAFKAEGRRKEAEDIWRRGLGVDPNAHALLSLLGELLCTEPTADRCRSEGLRLLKRSVALGETGKTRDSLAAALARTGDPAGALGVYEQALAENGDDAVAHVNLGLLLDAAGRPAEASGHYRLALRDRDQRAAAHADWGNSLLAQGRLDAAAFHYAEAIRLDPGLMPAQINLGNILVRRGRYAEAATHYRTALKKNPGSYEARANLSALRPVLDR